MTVPENSLKAIDRFYVDFRAGRGSGANEMSNVFTKHTSVVYESKGSNKTVPFKGQRLVVTIAKKTKNPLTGSSEYGQFLQQTRAMSIPILTTDSIDWDHQAVRLAVVELLKDVQKELIGDETREGHYTLTDEQIGQIGMLDYLNAVSTGDRWTTEKVSDWFRDTRGESLGVALATKLPDLDDAGLIKLMADNTAKFAEWVVSKSWSKDTAKKIVTRLELIDRAEWDAPAMKWYKKADAVLNPPAPKVALDLGLDD